jgi:hypothetical protein
MSEQGSMVRRRRPVTISRSPFPAPTRATFLCLTSVLAVISLLLSAVPVSAAPPSAGTEGFSKAETEHFIFYVQQDDPTAADIFVVAYGDFAEQGFSELSTVYGVSMSEKISVYVYSDQEAYNQAVEASGRREISEVDAFADPAALDISIFFPQFSARTDMETENALRHATSHVLTGVASGFNVPLGIDEGLAMYMERPVNQKLARFAGLVQNANQGDGTLSWSDLNRPNPPEINPDLLAAESYAMVAYLISRGRLPAIQHFLSALKTEVGWRDAVLTAFGRSSDDLERQWEENLPRWIAGGWKDNLIAGFNLEPAKALLAKGDYEGAKRALEQSQQLFTELKDEERKAEVEELISQCDTGIQAEALMLQVQQSLENHAYDRASTLLAQARGQYEQLPEDQRPTEMLATYEGIAATGIEAGKTLDEAIRLSQDWGDYPDARRAALDAGSAYASLGDEEMAGRAQSVLDNLQNRQRRIVLLLGALAIITVVWLALWLWTKGRSELDWS